MTGCSVKSIATGSLANTLTQTSGSTVFTGDEDPQFVGEALPVIIKIHESLVEARADDAALLRATGKLCVLYAYAYIQLPARTCKDRGDMDGYRREMQRAKRMFLRAREYCLQACEVRHPGFTTLVQQGHADSALAMTDTADTAYLYWTAMAWMGAITTDKNDFSLMLTMPHAVALMQRAYRFNPAFSHGAIHEFWLSYYASLPASMGGSLEKAHAHFDTAVSLSRGGKVGPYLDMAVSVAIKTQDVALFDAMLDSARAVPVDSFPSWRLLNTLKLQQVRRYEERRNELFLDVSPIQ
jgi:predicted anti-sigma-YlaC factor YlaD